MGLDMYLKAEKYSSANDWSNGNPVLTKEYKSTIKRLGLKMSDLEHVPFQSQTIKICIGYWRKANAIHRWFVKNVQNGVDDCRSYYVDLTKLDELKQLCETALKDVDRANEVLPTQSGFFFGSTEYGEWYIEDLKTTIKIVELAVSDKLKGFNIYYQSSW